MAHPLPITRRVNSIVCPSPGARMPAVISALQGTTWDPYSVRRATLLWPVSTLCTQIHFKLHTRTYIRYTCVYSALLLTGILVGLQLISPLAICWTPNISNCVCCMGNLLHCVCLCVCVCPHCHHDVGNFDSAILWPFKSKSKIHVHTVRRYNHLYTRRLSMVHFRHKYLYGCVCVGVQHESSLSALRMG